MRFRPCVVRSKMAMTLTIEEFFTSDTASLVSGGSMFRSTCGRMTYR